VLPFAVMEHTKPVPIRVSPELVERIDRVRGLVPRTAFVRYLLDDALKRIEAPDEKGGE
jgi:hypothetical protein